MHLFPVVVPPLMYRLLLNTVCYRLNTEPCLLLVLYRSRHNGNMGVTSLCG